MLNKALAVCHLASGDLWAGAEAQLSNLLTELVKLPDLSVHAILFNEGLLAERLRDNGVPVAVFPERRLSAVRLLNLLGRHLREMRTDLLHTHGYKQNVLGSIAATLVKLACVVRTEHGVNERLSGRAGLRMRAYQRMNRLTARLCSGVVAVSEDLGEKWQSYLGARGPTIAVVRNGVPIPPPLDPTVAARARARLGVSPDQVLFGTLGRMVPIKGLLDLVEAAALLHRREPRATFLLVGDGPLRAPLEARTTALGLEKIVRFVGFTPDPSEPLAALDVFVLSSLGEGVPMALLEALALGKPVVATAVGGVAEFLTSEVNALLVPAGTPGALAGACERLSQDPALRASLGVHGRALVERRLSASQMAAEVFDFYCRLMYPTASAEVLK